MDVLVYGLINSVTLAFFSIGFALVYGVSRIPNFAHGALYVFSGALCWTLLTRLGLNYECSIILSVLTTALIGALIYHLLLIRVRGIPFSEIVGSFSVGVIILEGLRIAGFGWSQAALPAYLEGTVEIFGVPLDWQRIIIVGAAIAMIAVLWAFSHFTKTGLGLSAIAQDESAALLLGIDTDLAATIAMAIGAASIAIAAMCIVPLGGIKLEAGYDVLIYALAVCVVGGLGSWVGVVFASFIIGYCQVIVVRFISPSFQVVVAMLAIILILCSKPSGLMGKQKELEERV